MTKTVILAGEPVAVPEFPLRLTIQAYPLCRKLANAEFAERYFAAVQTNSVMEVSSEELADLADVAFYGAAAADPTLTRAAFDEWPVKPFELIDAYFPIRLQTGGWIAGTAPQEGQEEPGEAVGA